MAKLTRSKLNKMKESSSHIISVNIDGDKIDIKIKDTLNTEEIECLISEMLAMQEFKINNGAYDMLDDNMLVIMLILKHITDLPYESKNTIEESLLDMINVTNIISRKETEEGFTLFEVTVNSIDEKVVFSLTEAINKAVDIVNSKIGGENA